MSIKFNPLIFGGFDLSGGGGGPAGAAEWKPPVANEAALPMVGNSPGDARVVLDTDKIYVWDDTTSKWIDSELTVAAFGSTPNADGISISSVTVGNITNPTINLQPADGTNPGAVSTLAQTFAGDKTFNDDIIVEGSIDAKGGIDSSTNTLTIGATADNINIGAPGATVFVQSDVLYVADKNITINYGGAATSGSDAGIEIEENLAITGFVKVTPDRNSWQLKAPNQAGVATIDAGAAGITIDQSSHDPVTLSAVGSSPNADGATLSGQVLNLEPADSTNPGVVSTSAQNFAGDKTFDDLVTALSGVETDSIDTITAGAGTLSIGTANASTINIGDSGVNVNLYGNTFYQDVTNLEVTDKQITLNKDGAIASAFNSGIELEENNVITGYVSTSSDRNSWELKAPNQAGVATISPGAAGITIDQSSHDPVTLGAVGSAPNGNGATLTGQVLNLEPADSTNPGVVSTGSQTLAGSKTFSSQIQADGGIDVTATPGVDVLNIGTANANTVNIGSNGSSVNIDGTVNIDYTPADPTDWAPAPNDVIEAIDQLADRFVTQNNVTNEPTGFPNRTDSTISFNDLTREFTIAPVSGSFDFYLKGQKFTKTTTQIITLPNLPGDHYIYFDATGSLTSTQSFSSDIITLNAIVSIVYWNTDTNKHTYFGEERHGLTMDGVTHAYLHTVFGARYLSGLALQGFTIGSGGSNADAQFTSDQGSIRDEDILHIIPAQAQIPILYRQGQLWRKKPADAYPVIYSSTAPGSIFTGANGRLPYNQYTGGAWQLTQIGNSEYVLVHFFGTNDKDNPVVGIQGINVYNSAASARIGANVEISSLSGMPFAEFVPIGSVIFESANSFGNAIQARVFPTDTGANYVDFRGTQLYTPAGTATTHGLLSGLNNDDHIQYLLADGTRPMSGDLQMNQNDITGIKSATFEDGTVYGSITNDTGALKVQSPGIVVQATTGSITLDVGGPGPESFFLNKQGTSYGEILFDSGETYFSSEHPTYFMSSNNKVTILAATGYEVDLSSDTSVNVLTQLDMTNNKIVDVLDPVDPQDAATKNYVDGLVTGTNSAFAGFDSTTGVLTEVPGYTFDDDGALQIGAQNSITIPAGITDYSSISISPTVANTGLANLSGIQLNSPINQSVTNYNGFQAFGYGTSAPDNFTGYLSQPGYTGSPVNITHFSASGSADCTGNFIGLGVTSSSDADDITGVNISTSGNSTNLVGVELIPSGTHTDATGLKIDLSSATITNRPVGIDVTGGTVSATTTITTSPSLPQLVDSANIIRPIFEVESGSPITGTDVIMNNFAGFMQFSDDHSGSALDIGVSSVGFVSQVAADAGATADKISMLTAGLAVDSTSANGTVTDAHLIRAFGLTFPGGLLNIDNIYGLKIENSISSLATNAYGISVEDTSADNFLAKSLTIGGITKQTTNNEIALEVDAVKSIRLGRATTIQRTGLTNLSGLLIYDSNTNKYYGNDGSGWKEIQYALGAADIAKTPFTALDNQIIPDNITGLAFDNSTVRGFEAQVTIVRGSSYAEYSLKGIQKGASWEMSQDYIGDDTGLVFSINSSGQVQYTSSNTGNTAAILFRANTV